MNPRNCPISQMNDCRKSVVVVGAGPTGLTLANCLGLAGIDVLVVERNATTVQEPRAVSIDDESLRTMQAIGLIDHVLPDLVLGYGSHYFSPRGRCFAKVQPQTREFGYPRRSAFRQPLLEAQLRAGLQRFANVETWFNSEVTGLEQDAEGVRLQVRGQDGKTATVACDYVAACDGGKSTVRRQLGLKLEGSTFAERWLIVDLEGDTDPFRHTKVFCDPRRPCLSLPGPHATRRFEFMLFQGESDEEAVSADFVTKLLESHGMASGSTISRVRVYTFHARVANRWSEGRIFLAGDAAHLTPPFAGQGMNSGIRDAFNLGWKLAAVLGGTAGAGLLQSYEQERKPHIWQMIDLAMKMGRVMMPKDRFSAASLQLGLRALGLYPAARDYVAEMKYKPKPRFVLGFFVPDDKGTRRTLVGRMFPQPIVMRVDGKLILLDEALGTGFALVAFGQTPERELSGWVQPIWKKIGTRRIGIYSLPCALPRQAAQAGILNAAVVDNERAVAAAWQGYEGQVLALRPDRYVMGAFPASDPGSAALAIENLLNATWSDRVKNASLTASLTVPTGQAKPNPADGRNQQSVVNSQTPSTRKPPL
jgi:3-(3-hydroxy-phenyl)propionate hydroxylase